MDAIPTIELARLDELYLDPKNPRLGRHNIEKALTQEDVLTLMQDWVLDELAVSFLESGFWPQEPLIVVQEALFKRKKPVLVVIEGNRRLAALKMIQRAREGAEVSVKWRNLLDNYPEEAFARLQTVPYILKPSRESVRAYLGFRHVTGIKEWNPAEKAQFIAHLIDKNGLTYEQVRRRIGTNASSVRQHYLAYRVLLQMEEQTEEIDIEKVEERFSVLYLSLRALGVQQYLQVQINAEPGAVLNPVPTTRLKQLVNYARWLFGTKKKPPLVAESRDVDDFGRILESETAIQYLERSESPSFAVARRMAGVAESVVAEHLERAADETEEALKVVHLFKSSVRIEQAAKRLGADIVQLLAVFSHLKQELLRGEK